MYTCTYSSKMPLDSIGVCSVLTQVVKNNDRIPADMVILGSSHNEGHVFIETARRLCFCPPAASGIKSSPRLFTDIATIVGWSCI